MDFKLMQFIFFRALIPGLIIINCNHPCELLHEKMESFLTILNKEKTADLVSFRYFNLDIGKSVGMGIANANDFPQLEMYSLFEDCRCKYEFEIEKKNNFSLNLKIFRPMSAQADPPEDQVNSEDLYPISETDNPGNKRTTEFLQLKTWRRNGFKIDSRITFHANNPGNLKDLSVRIQDILD